MRKLIFSEQITLHEINPHNFALKNDYISNLIDTAMLVIPPADALLPDRNLRVVTGFLSRSYILEQVEKDTDLFTDLIQHSEGLAIELTWDNFTPDEAIALARNYMSVKMCVKILINNKKKTISFFLKEEKNKILEKSINGIRLVYKE